jgi:Ca2+-binding RTX toxin-like protein
MTMQVYSGRANITTASGGDGVVLHLDQGNANVRSLGADTIYAGSGDNDIIVSGAATVYAGSGRLNVYGRSDYAEGGARVYGNGGDYLIGGDTGNITYYGGDKASTVTANLSNITLVGGTGRLTIYGGSRDTVLGGAGGLVYHNFGCGANTVTTMAGSSNLLEISADDLINSYGNDTIIYSGGNATINIYGDSTLTKGDGNSHITLGGRDTVTVAPANGGNNWFNVLRGADVSISAKNLNWIHQAAGAEVNVAFTNPNTPRDAATTVRVTGGIADLCTDPNAGVSVSTDGSSPVDIAADGGPVSVISRGADTIHLGSGAATVRADGVGAEVWGGSGDATVSSGNWASDNITTVHGGSGSMSLVGCAGTMKFIGGSGSAVILGTYGSLHVVGGAGDTTVNWSSPYGEQRLSSAAPGKRP